MNMKVFIKNLGNKLVLTREENLIDGGRCLGVTRVVTAALEGPW